MIKSERVYLIGSPTSPLVKIGWTDNPERRLRHLQTGSPVPLQLLALFEGGSIVEAELHRRFADKRRHGEWFDLGPNPVEVVSPFARVAQVDQAKRIGPRQPKHELLYDDVTPQEWADCFPEDPPRVHERMERECPTYKGVWKCLCGS
ncbi:GIY-YIG nuclease family protein [Streptomyces stelliscabiei]|uniref:GIY-YIG nuclease family protein n=1 Tax=Streptomyces stelliscabiei TaxID=146820 RepID=UPI0029A2A4A1|nr:GIY-YIG nuclease family protein [Streptomyces stelliscabiei]MDX2557636.1 GIY-YIG nuclease family protein [Streptomyces stelliscabiei]MDX2617111.1 GIY-YIG nuclease family protein [Streptomyces stelliscabiei]MDX2641485.1 GIY-YIG nuclease family protein [Streptomyces stelliscabiei]MDX2666465.1 GIY-YIG nuclease family protein [Streptomyces stelliscabiei]MDX2717338.1 GIY-YIG nuclease family protein [Streptomyces stelliscabiei]